GVVIHNGIGRHVLEAARSGRGASREGRGAGDRFRFVFAGRRSHDKGYPDLLAAAGRLRKRGRRFVLEAVGPASPGTGTDIRKAERALGDAFRDHGAVEREDWFRIAAGAEAFVLPSHLEGLPMALLEAMAFSLGIIATPVGGVPEAVGPAEALLVPPRDPGAIDHAMASFLDDPEGCRALGRAARLRVEHGFTMERCARRYEEIYRGVLEG
ncbi:MAG TPA: glycosyltransferase family 4 protein, partial [Thermoplasmata archaeon]|nr:glycosyltransferase family 4 protein [Thermoplasmata archaeon]